MRPLTKKILTGLMAGFLIFSGVGEVSALSAPKQTENELWAKETAEWFGITEKEVLGAIEAGKTHEDIGIAAMLSKISGKSFNTVMNMKVDWVDVMKRLGVSREKYDEACREMMIKSIAISSELDESTVKNLLENHYHPRDIRIAGRLAKASGKNVQEILDSKKINQRWIDVAEKLKVDKNLAEVEDEENPPSERPEPPAE